MRPNGTLAKTILDDVKEWTWLRLTRNEVWRGPEGCVP